MPMILSSTTVDNAELTKPGAGALSENAPARAAASRSAESPRKILLISNEVMHYRVPVYNYFHRRFREYGYEFCVIADRLQRENRKQLQFELQELPFDFGIYKRVISEAQPAAVILFLHLKDLFIWPLMHWMKVSGIPFAFWTKGGNWDAKGSKWRYLMFNYVHALSDSLILYAQPCKDLITPRHHPKAFVANNTVNFDDYPSVSASREEIKLEFGIPFTKTVIFMGRMGVGGGRKRVDHLIEIFRTLDRTDVGLVLVGSGLSEELKARMNTRNTIYLGEVQDDKDLQISKLCKMADVCAIPGHVGLGLNQAFYWGLPVVTEEGDHPPEVFYLKNGRNGFMVPGNDLTEMKERLLDLLDNDTLRTEFSRHAREDILREASIEGMFSAFKDSVDYMKNKAENRPAKR
jgi:glycosyltransferase involved in cell wall biosynthesis